jgi:PhzF family phenazine biosynthesis protein
MTTDRTTYRALLVDAFADEPLAGVPIGVLSEADDLSEAQMRAVATELGPRATAFVRPSVDGERRLRVYGPTGEWGRHDDAILAAYAQRYAENDVDPGEYVVDVRGPGTEAGGSGDDLVDVEVDDDGTVWVSQPAAEVQSVDLAYDRAGAALGIDPATLRDVGADVPAAVAATREPYLLVPVNFLSALSGADPDPEALADLCETHDVTGVYAFTFDTLSADATLHARVFAPGGGAGTGAFDPGSAPPELATAAGACGAYLQIGDAFDDPPEVAVIEQGHFRDRPSLLRVRTGAQIRVGGRAVTSLDGQLIVPAEEDDDIVEA